MAPFKYRPMAPRLFYSTTGRRWAAIPSRALSSAATAPGLLRRGRDRRYVLSAVARQKQIGFNGWSVTTWRPDSSERA